MDKTIEQIKRAHQGDKTAREALVKDNLGLVWSIVRRFAGRGCETEDLFQIGSIGLLKAIDKFDLSYEVRFSTYAVPPQLLVCPVFRCVPATEHMVPQSH